MHHSKVATFIVCYALELAGYRILDAAVGSYKGGMSIEVWDACRREGKKKILVTCIKV